MCPNTRQTAKDPTSLPDSKLTMTTRNTHITQEESLKFRFLMAAGGTGGHVYPAVAIADALRFKAPGSEFLFVGTRDRMEWKAVPKAGYHISPVWISGFHRRFTLKNLLFPVKVVVSLLQSFTLVRRFKPDAVVACGGFASGPVGWVAAKLGIPLFLQEQNSFPGVTTRLLADKARAIYLTMPLIHGDLVKEKCEVLGNPVRASFLNEVANSSKEKARDWVRSLGLNPDQPLVLVLGGSGGSDEMNQAVWKQIRSLAGGDFGVQLLWQAGTSYVEGYEKQVDASLQKYIRLVGFIDEMPLALRAADIVVSRAGAGALSELMLFGKTAILVPSAHVAGDHQRKNALWMVDQGAAIMLESHQLPLKLSETVRDLIEHPEKRKALASKAALLAKPDAAMLIADKILHALNSQLSYLKN